MIRTKRTVAARLLAILMAAVFALTTIPAASLQTAYADDFDTEVARTAQAYDEAVAEQSRIQGEMDELDARIATIEEQLPVAQHLSNESLVALYKFSNDTLSLITALLSSSNLGDVLAMWDAYNWIIDSNMANVQQMVNLRSELEESRTQMEASKAAADTAAAAAETALAEAQAARQAAQEAAIAAQQREQQQAANNSGGSNSSSNSGSNSPAANASNVNWSSDKQAFVNEWAPRINNYLAGSPMAGLGNAYASAAWDYGVDPRWAPAISCTESGKGRVCFRPYNAWGYGSFSFSSYEEGIRRVCACLGGSTYGGYLTERGAQLYAGTSNWREWYDWICREMASI